MYGVQVANPVRPSMCADLFILARSAFEFDTPVLRHRAIETLITMVTAIGFSSSVDTLGGSFTGVV